MTLYKQRPESLKRMITTEFAKLKDYTREWGLYNGSEDYHIACIDTFKLLKSQILKAPTQKIFNVMDIGAGNGDAGRFLSKAINDSTDIPSDVKVNIFNIRAEKNLYDFPVFTESTRCNVYECSGFNAENLIDELERIGHSDKQFDIVMSRWCMRHLVDPVGTFEQVYLVTKPETGYIMMDGFHYKFADDNKESWGSNSNNQIISILHHTNSKFLVLPYDTCRSFDQFILQKGEEVLELSLTYTTERLCSLGLQAGKHYSMTVFERSCEESVKWVFDHGPIAPYALHGLLGNKDLYESLQETFCEARYYSGANAPQCVGHFEIDVPLITSFNATDAWLFA